MKTIFSAAVLFRIVVLRSGVSRNFGGVLRRRTGRSGI